jgi:hypothetical protein
MQKKHVREESAKDVGRSDVSSAVHNTPDPQ